MTSRILLGASASIAVLGTLSGLISLITDSIDAAGAYGLLALAIIAFFAAILQLKKSAEIDPGYRAEKVLHKEAQKPVKAGGPYWWNFVHKEFVEHPKSVEIIDQVRKQPLHLIMGPRASGKTVLLRSLAYSLARKRRSRVYMLDCAICSSQEIEAFAEKALLPLHDHKRITIIIDNVQHEQEACGRVLERYIEAGLRKLRIILASRPLSHQRRVTPLGLQQLQENPEQTTEIFPEDISAEIIHAHFEKSHHEYQEPPNTAGDPFDGFRKDLWILHYALDSYRPSYEVSGIQIDDLYDKIAIQLRQLPPGQAEILLAVALVHAFGLNKQEDPVATLELGIEEAFLTDDTEGLGLDAQLIESLVVAGNLVRKPIRVYGRERHLLMLEHQSVAELFLETFLMREVDANALKRLLRRTGAKKTENLRFDFISYYAAHSNLFEYFGPADDSLAFDDFLSMIPTRPELQQRIVEIWTNQFAQIDASEQFGWLLTRLYFAPLPIQADLARAIRLDGLAEWLSSEASPLDISNFLSIASVPIVARLLQTWSPEALLHTVKDDLPVLATSLLQTQRANPGFANKLLGLIGEEKLIRNLKQGPWHLEELTLAYMSLSLFMPELGKQLVTHLKAQIDGLPDRGRKEEAINYLRELRYLIGTGTPDEDDLFTEIESRITPGTPLPQC